VEIDGFESDTESAAGDWDSGPFEDDLSKLTLGLVSSSRIV